MTPSVGNNVHRAVNHRRFKWIVLAGLFSLIFAAGGIWKKISEFSGDNADFDHQPVVAIAGVLLSIVAASVFAYADYLKALAAKYPSTHSPQGRLQKIYQATKHVEIKDKSQAGFYANASDMELHNFYRKLSKSPTTAKYCALILEIRNRVGGSYSIRDLSR